MRIPPYYKRPGWQRFLAGVLIGILIGWSIFIYQFGHIQERTIVELRKNELTVEQLENQIDLLLAREQENDEEGTEELTVESVSIHFENEREVRLSELVLYDLRQQAIDELEPLLNQNLESVAENQEIVIRALENKRFMVNDYEYSLRVKRAVIYRMVDIHAEIVPATRSS